MNKIDDREETKPKYHFIFYILDSDLSRLTLETWSDLMRKHELLRCSCLRGTRPFIPEPLSIWKWENGKISLWWKEPLKSRGSWELIRWPSIYQSKDTFECRLSWECTPRMFPAFLFYFKVLYRTNKCQSHGDKNEVIIFSKRNT